MPRPLTDALQRFSKAPAPQNALRPETLKLEKIRTGGAGAHQHAPQRCNPHIMRLAGFEIYFEDLESAKGFLSRHAGHGTYRRTVRPPRPVRCQPVPLPRTQGRGILPISR